MWWLAPAALAGPFDAELVIERVHATASHRSARISDSAPALSDEVYRQAATGKIATGVVKVEGHAAKIGYGVGVVDVGIDALWAALNDETRHGSLSPLSHVEIVKGSRCADRRQVLMVLPLPLLTDRFWVNENRYNPALSAATDGQVRELAWSSMADPATAPMSDAGRAAVDGLVPIGFNRGAWYLTALDAGHTLAEYHSWVDPGGSVPSGPASMFATSGIEDTFAAMETYAKKSGSRCTEAG